MRDAVARCMMEETKSAREQSVTGRLKTSLLRQPQQPLALCTCSASTHIHRHISAHPAWLVQPGAASPTHPQRREGTSPERLERSEALDPIRVPAVRLCTERHVL
eukprot:366048-Chlamydomonas_euryale.AAC.13